MATERELGQSTGAENDKLTDINGIGPAAERDLHSLGIRRFSDLTQYTADELARILFDHTGNARYSVTRIEKDDWIGQAKELAAGKPAESSEDDRAPLPEALPQTLLPETSSAVQDWKPHAEFMLVFESRASEQDDNGWQTRVWKTRIHDRECDMEEVFDGIRPAPWVSWILEHARLNHELEALSGEELVALTSPTEDECAEAHPPPPDESVSINILGIDVSQAEPSAELPGENLAVEVTFQVAGADLDALLADGALYQVEVHTVNQEDGNTDLVAHGRGQLQPGKSEYMCRQIFPMPDVGRYTLEVIVLLIPIVALPAVQESEPFNVVP